MKFDTFVAALFLLAAALVSFSAYRAIDAVERPRGALLQSIPLGDHNYSVFSGEQCVGTFTTFFHREQQTIIRSNGDYSFSYQGHIFPVQSVLGAYFNALEQLVACNLTVEGSDFRVEIKQLNPNPMRIDIEAHFFGRTVTRQITLPGPVMLRANGDGTYRIDYLLAQKLNPAALPRAFQLPTGPADFSSMDFRVSSFEQKPAACNFSDSNVKPLDMDPLAEQVRSFLPLIQNFSVH